jgi:hypothetical protein
MSRRFPVRIHECALPDGSLRRGCHCDGHTDDAGAAAYVATGEYGWHDRPRTVWHSAIVRLKPCQTGRTRSNGSAPKGVRATAPNETEHSNRVFSIVDSSNRVSDDPAYWNKLLADAGLSVSAGKFLTDAPEGKGRIETGGYTSAKCADILGRREEAVGVRTEPKGHGPMSDTGKRTGNYDEEEAAQSGISTAVGVVKILETSCTVCGEFKVRRMFLPARLGRAKVKQSCICRKCFEHSTHDGGCCASKRGEFGWHNPENDFTWSEFNDEHVQVPQSQHRTPNMLTAVETYGETQRRAQEAKRKRTTAYSIES